MPTPGRSPGSWSSAVRATRWRSDSACGPTSPGKAWGPSFVEAALAFARDRWSPSTFALDVFAWNERAIRAYEHAGFVRGEIYLRRFENGNARTFLSMTRPA